MTTDLQQHRRLDGPFGLEMEVDFEASLGEDQISELRRLLAENQLLVIRTEGLTSDQQHQFVGHFAAAHGKPTELKRLTNDVPAAAGSGELLFHSDYTYLSVPLFGISLYAESAAEDSAPTAYANAAFALERLPADLRTRIEGRLLLHLWERNNRGTRHREAAATVGGAGAVHPIIWKSALSGSEFLGVTQLAAARVLGMSEVDSDALLDELFAHLYQPAHIYTHHWRTGDLVIWDNMALQHSRQPGPVDGQRRLRRTTFGMAGFESLIQEMFGWASP